MMDVILKVKSACSKNLEFLEIFENFINVVEKTELFRDKFGIEFIKKPLSLEFVFLTKVFRFDYSFVIDSQMTYWGRLTLIHLKKISCSGCPLNGTTEEISKTFFFDKFGNTKRSLEETSLPMSIGGDSIKEFVVTIFYELLNADLFAV